MGPKTNAKEKYQRMAIDACQGEIDNVMAELKFQAEEGLTESMYSKPLQEGTISSLRNKGFEVDHVYVEEGLIKKRIIRTIISWS